MTALTVSAIIARTKPTGRRLAAILPTRTREPSVIPTSLKKQTLGWGATVESIAQPTVADQLRHLGSVGAPRAAGADDPVLEFAQRRIQPVADLVFHEIPEFLHRGEFGTVGRQRQQSPIGGQPGSSGADVETGLVLDDDMPGVRLGLADLLEKKHRHVLIDAG